MTMTVVFSPSRCAGMLFLTTVGVLPNKVPKGEGQVWELTGPAGGV